MVTAGGLEQGREAFARHAWKDAYGALSGGDGAELGPQDVDRLATAAYLLGKDTECEELWPRAFQGFVNLGDAPSGARCAFWLGMTLMLRGEVARGGGWLARAGRVLEEANLDCVERGYLLVPHALHALDAGDAATSHTTFSQVVEIGERFGDPDLVTLGRLGRGQALIGLGRAAEAVALFDEAMVAVTADEVSPIPAGIIYCAVILACQQIFDTRRCQEWTTALHRWCESQQELVPYRGQCLVHRSEIMQLQGAWADALTEARLACERLSEPPRPAVGMAHYQLGELHRLRGELSKAEDAYRQAHQHGREPQPGLALLRLAQGRSDAAAAAIRRVLDETDDRVTRSRMLPAHVEIALAAGDVATARTAADELADIAGDLDALLLRALSADAHGAVLLAEGDARAALDRLRQAWTVWQELEAPYEAARTRVLIGLACRTLGDDDTAEMELDAARRRFDQLGAAPELARVQALSTKPAPRAVGGLTVREVEVLGLVATGKTNREVAAELVISERTVARHVSNIFVKLGVSSRAAATAYAYEHGIAGQDPM